MSVAEKPWMVEDILVGCKEVVMYGGLCCETKINYERKRFRGSAQRINEIRNALAVLTK